MNTLSPVLLQHLSKQITSGRALVGLFHAREYLEPTDLMWKSLVKLATPQLRSARYAAVPALVESALEGATLASLSNELQKQFKDFREIQFVRTQSRAVPTMRSWREQTSRRSAMGIAVGNYVSSPSSLRNSNARS